MSRSTELVRVDKGFKKYLDEWKMAAGSFYGNMAQPVELTKITKKLAHRLPRPTKKNLKEYMI